MRSGGIQRTVNKRRRSRKSRPRVSNDNPYSESIFKTLKYRPNYQPKGFETVEEARKWCSVFVHWYRYDHHHSGIKFLTPAERHKGKSEEILANRTKVHETAKAAHPERWNGRQTRNWSNIEKAYLNPDKKMVNKRNQIVRSMRLICAKVTGFINKNTECLVY